MKIDISKRELLYFSLLLIFLIAVSFIFSYKDFLTGDPIKVGHSSDEVHVKVGGVTKTLQQLVDEGFIGGKYVPSDVKATTASHNGLFYDATATPTENGYKDMNDWIQTNGCLGYHVCTYDELLDYQISGGSIDSFPYSNYYWTNLGSNLFNGPIDSIDSSDCQGWSSTSNFGTGVTVYKIKDSSRKSLKAIYSETGHLCTDLNPVLCCK